MNLNKEQLRVLRHMLGIDKPYIRNPIPYRDYYCARKGDTELQELAEHGAVSLYRQCETYDWYRTTEAGKAAAIASHKQIRMTKAKRVYRAYLRMSDTYQDLTFKQFLTDPDFRDVRIAA
jgi:hypothetical protein